MCYIYPEGFELFFSFFLLYTAALLDITRARGTKEKKEFDLKEKKTLHSSTVFWDLGLLEFMKADGFPVVRKG